MRVQVSNKFRRSLARRYSMPPPDAVLADGQAAPPARIQNRYAGQALEARQLQRVSAHLVQELRAALGVLREQAGAGLWEAAIQQSTPDLSQLLHNSAQQWQVQQNAALRQRFVEQCQGMLSSHQVADLLGSRAKNRAALANQLKDSKRVLALRLHGQDWYPACQFDAQAGRVWPEMAELIRLLERDYEAGWQLALWLITPHAWLQQAAPLTFWLQGQRAAVLQAAREEMAAFAA
ncbi:hypothetical protein V8J88_17215 [Massilia sp. W12]|uniref:hypothetical protein n=1 Tax=Massilia sp. W12 TaxID=3126507 RepID=UPI0030CD27F0